MNVGVEDINAEGAKPISHFPTYIPPRKLTAKLTKDPDSLKFKVFTPFFPEEVPIEDDLLARVPYLNMKYWDLSDLEKFPQLEPNKYLKMVYYDEAGITRLEPMKWAIDIECVGLFNMWYVPHFCGTIINTICVPHLLALVHDGCLWMVGPILIDEMLIQKFTALPY